MHLRIYVSFLNAQKKYLSRTSSQPGVLVDNGGEHGELRLVEALPPLGLRGGGGGGEKIGLGVQGLGFRV